jgi:hypothetical protein
MVTPRTQRRFDPRSSSGCQIGEVLPAVSNARGPGPGAPDSSETARRYPASVESSDADERDRASACIIHSTTDVRRNGPTGLGWAGSGGPHRSLTGVESFRPTEGVRVKLVDGRSAYYPMERRGSMATDPSPIKERR